MLMDFLVFIFSYFLVFVFSGACIFWFMSMFFLVYAVVFSSFEILVEELLKRLVYLTLLQKNSTNRGEASDVEDIDDDLDFDIDQFYNED